MVVNKGILEGIWVSAMESYLQIVGTFGTKTTMVVFLGLLWRLHVSDVVAIRVVQRWVGDCVNGEGSRIRNASCGSGMIFSLHAFLHHLRSISTVSTRDPSPLWTANWG